jgi:hypothetical protein
LGEVQVKGRLQNRIDRREQRLVHIIQQVAEADREQDREGRRLFYRLQSNSLEACLGRPGKRPESDTLFSQANTISRRDQPASYSCSSSYR